MTMPTPDTRTADQIVADEAANDEVLARDFAAKHKGTITHVATESRSVWLDGGEYYSALVAYVWNGTDVVPFTVCTNGESGWIHRHNNLPDLKADATAEVVALIERKHEEEKRVAEALEAAAERKRVKAGAFCIVTSGRKVPLGTVGRCVHVSEGQYGLRAGIATSTRTEVVTRNGRTYVNAVDTVWTDVNNVTVLMPHTPAATHELETLYQHGAVVAAHTTPEHFEGFWKYAYGCPYRLAVIAAFSPEDLVRAATNLNDMFVMLNDAPEATVLGSLGSAKVFDPNSVRNVVGLVMGKDFVAALSAPTTTAKKVRKPRTANKSV